jgi:thiamine-phosphate pyrophosphorylase
MTIFPTRGLYAITQIKHKTEQQVIAEVAAAIKGGAVVIQYRHKPSVPSLSLSRQLLVVCRQAKVPLIINDNLELAVTIGADGVHLGQHDSTIDQAREQLGTKAIIGLSCYNDMQSALDAEKKGANYVAFGRFFASSSKPLATTATLNTLQRAKAQLTMPIVAIGGILPDNGQQLLTAGADLLAVIAGVFTEDVEQSAHAYQALFKSLSG